MSTRGRRIGCHDPPQMFADSAIGEPTKPSKTRFVGFVGASCAIYIIIQTHPSDRWGASLRLHCAPSGAGARAIGMGLDSPTKTKRLMSWSERTSTAPGLRGSGLLAKAEA